MLCLLSNRPPAAGERVDEQRVPNRMKPMMRRELFTQLAQGDGQPMRVGKPADREVRADRAELGLGPMIRVGDPLDEREPKLAHSAAS